MEVTKLSLLLKVLEGETGQTLQTIFRLFSERALPDLGDNIKCGNSLIGPDFYQQAGLPLLTDEERYRINVFDWQAEFADIFKAGGFDAVIGNPPYVRQESLSAFKDYFEQHYEASDGVADLYTYFMEKGVKLLRDGGLFSAALSSIGWRTGSQSCITVWRLGKHCCRVRRHESVVLNLPHDLHTTRAPVQGLPDFQQRAIPVFSPLVVPEAEFFDVLRGEEFFAFLAALDLFRKPVLKTIQLHRQASQRAKDIEVVFSKRMLPPEFEASKSSGPQSPPELLLFVRLFTAKAAGVGDEIHAGKNRRYAIADKPLSLALSPLLRRGERECLRVRASQSEGAAPQNAVREAKPKRTQKNPLTPNHRPRPWTGSRQKRLSATPRIFSAKKRRRHITPTEPTL